MKKERKFDDHLIGEYREVARSNYSLNNKVPKFIPIHFRNFFGYKTHLFVKKFGEDYNNVNLISNNEEKYISFKIIKYDFAFWNIKDQIFFNIKFRFLDSYKFLSSSPSQLVKIWKNVILNNWKKWFDTSVPKNLSGNRNKIFI